MAPTPNATATPRRRQSCDRCHGQKLRCIRAGNSETGACNRCVRQGAQCVYSSSLPKGRPSMYRIADVSAAPSDSPTVTPVTPPELCHGHPASLHTATADANANASLSWNDMQVDGSEQDSSQWTSNSHAIGNSQTNTSAAFLDTFPGLLDWASTGNGDGEASAQTGPPSPTRLHEHGHGLGSGLFGSGSSIIIDKNGPDVGIARLSQLSTRLYPLHRSSCTLAETAGSSGQSRNRNQARRSPLIDDAAFKSVSAWISHVSADVNLLSRTDRQNPAFATETTTTGDTLHDAFSASHHLLEILRCLQGDLVTGTLPSTSTVSTSTSTSTGGAHLKFWANVTPPFAQSTSISNENTSYFEQGKVSPSYARLSQYSNTVVRHLVIACHTLLFNIYVAVLIALQHDVDLRSPCLPTDGCVDDAALADIRLVLVLQLCSYLIERQRQAVDLYLSHQSPLPPSQQHDISGFHQSNPPASSAGNGEVMGHLDMEVQQRLARLRQTLRI